VDRAIVLEVTRDFDLTAADPYVSDVVSAALEPRGLENSITQSADVPAVATVAAAVADVPQAAETLPDSAPIERVMFASGTRRRFSFFGAR
jgi:hypothetical protein